MRKYTFLASIEYWDRNRVNIKSDWVVFQDTSYVSASRHISNEYGSDLISFFLEAKDCNFIYLTKNEYNRISSDPFLEKNYDEDKENENTNKLKQVGFCDNEESNS